MRVLNDPRQCEGTPGAEPADGKNMMHCDPLRDRIVREPSALFEHPVAAPAKTMFPPPWWPGKVLRGTDRLQRRVTGGEPNLRSQSENAIDTGSEVAGPKTCTSAFSACGELWNTSTPPRSVDRGSPRSA